ncbi:Hsp20/alpha crystallin family protein [Roseofilum reptotaenium CS-1145]|uniref:Molecular chaperone n=1 Tax=Roseofilum reptotaenium AO1-A TaxID=1925591 RepID=A0A1L9QQL9_9CYAN|nr:MULTISPECIES: Hsp20/alpha crystallin family protein [Roseofilum]MBP0027681.1 Hsp20/alpha crystallin family protein [Roseofilum sp. Guam]MDB9516592.1 Hsp20/alpha crystallin family protein [Roseofilum reptotaenium CS-1145]OJJ24887.1 molecular chaperone [Roseofilum reptotaenium AO1-A]
MPLVRWEPFREIDTLQRQMNRLFDDLVPKEVLSNQGNFLPAAELHETPEAFEIKLEVPGMKPDDLDIQVTAEAVSISGERRSERTTEEKGVTRSEFRYGQFQRVVPLPNRIQNNNVEAEYKDGILHLTLPKVEEEQHKVVKVKVG